MKKITALLILLLIIPNVFSQVIPLKDTENNEIYGYVVFNIVEKVDKKHNLYLANLLDANLNQVAQSTFTGEDNAKVGKVHYNGNSIYFEVIPKSADIKSVASKDFTYHIYNLKTNKVSKGFKLPKVDKNIFVRGSYPVHGHGFGIMIRNFKSQVNEFYAVDDQNGLLYKSFPYGNPKKKKETEHIVVGDIQNGLLASISKKYPHKRSNDPKTTLLLNNAITGEKVGEVSLDTDGFDIYLSNVQIGEDKIFVFGDLYEKRKKLSSDKTAGLFKAELDHQGNVLKENSVVWADLQSKIDIKEGGFVKNKGFIYTHDYVWDKETDHTIVVGEYIKGALSSVSVEDLIFLDFDEKFNLVHVFEVPTKKAVLHLNSIKLGGSRDFANMLRDYNYFDYRFSNFLENETGLSFFYFNLEKVRLFSGDFSHGMVVYKDGKFTANKLKWDTSVWKKEYLNLLPAKPGYILLSKISKDRILENRLERLDY